MMQNVPGGFSVPAALLGQIVIFAVFAMVVWALLREAARVVIKALVFIGIGLAIAVMAGWLDQTTVGYWLEQVGEWLLTGIEAVTGFLLEAWQRVSGAAQRG